ncbi:MAG: site-specific integrase [Bacteroidota bacterium]|nr:site-specific integrase [Bacteroidota bacterium]MDP4257426.1 site-specific integrase [Bacteroidota bacterium]
MAIRVDIYHDKRRFRSKTKDYPVKLRIYETGDMRMYTTVYGITADEIKAWSQQRVSEKVQNLRKAFNNLRVKAQEAADELDPFDFDQFELRFIKDNPEIDQTKLKIKVSVPAQEPFDLTEYYKRFPILQESLEIGTIGHVFKELIKFKIVIGKVSTAILYQSAYISLVKFGGNVKFKRINKLYLYNYTEWMKGLGNSKTTVGMYIRHLRHVFNEAHDMKIIKKENCYPFGKKEYRIPGTRSVKKVYEVEELRKIYGYQCDPEKPWLQRAKDYSLFILFGNGINPADIVRLKRKNIQGNLIVFERVKTEEIAKEDPPSIAIYINDEIKQIIDRQCSRDENGNIIEDPESYLFPILKPGMNPLREYQERQLLIEFINKWLSFILKEVGVNKPGRCYYLRSTFATMQIAGGASLFDVQEFMGHMDPRTTKRYVGSLPIEQKRLASQRMEIIKGPNDKTYSNR